MTDVAIGYGLIGLSIACSAVAVVYCGLALNEARKIINDRMSDEPDMNAWPVRNDALKAPQPRDEAGRFVSLKDRMTAQLRAELGRVS